MPTATAHCSSSLRLLLREVGTVLDQLVDDLGDAGVIPAIEGEHLFVRPSETDDSLVLPAGPIHGRNILISQRGGSDPGTTQSLFIRNVVTCRTEGDYAKGQQSEKESNARLDKLRGEILLSIDRFLQKFSQVFRLLLPGSRIVCELLRQLQLPYLFDKFGGRGGALLHEDKVE